MENYEYILVLTTSCPKCPEAKQILYKASIVKELDYMVYDERTIGYDKIVKEYNLMMAPSLVIKKKTVTKVLSGLEEIKKFFFGNIKDNLYGEE